MVSVASCDPTRSGDEATGTDGAPAPLPLPLDFVGWRMWAGMGGRSLGEGT